jgi:S-disulfanyl-L-cysteine oxidoreductase SoxD
MFNSLKVFLLLGLCALSVHAQPKIGRVATPAEVAAWDIDVRPDFKGLPRGQGTVAQGELIWEGKCASCHGSFGELNTVFYPITGGFKKGDVERGRVAEFSGPNPERTTLSKLSSVSTLWDYINRAMPWNNPKTLSADDVYAVTAYTLHLADMLPGDFTLSDKNIAEVQKRLPNRNGLTTDHGMWRVAAKPDVKAAACMNNCEKDVKVVSSIPTHARDAHGNLADQMRPAGGVRGQVTVAQVKAGSANAAAQAPAANQFANVKELLNKGLCLSCHQVDRKVVGPSYAEITAKYKSDSKAEAYLASKIKNGGQGVWGAIPMPATAGLSEAESALLAKWILQGAP